MSDLTLDALVDYVCDRRYVSYVELKREFGASGHYSNECIPNGFDMLNCSKELIECVGEAIRARRIEVLSSSRLVYFLDGEVPNLPLAKRFSKKGYKKPHWIPVTFDRPSAKTKHRSIPQEHGQHDREENRKR